MFFISRFPQYIRLMFLFLYCGKQLLLPAKHRI